MNGAETFVDEVDALLELLDRRLRELDRHHRRLTVIERRRLIPHVDCSCAVCERESGLFGAHRLDAGDQ